MPENNIHIFKLVKPARSSGGDRYECQLEGESKAWTVYFPQSITRAYGEPKKTLRIRVLGKGE